MVFPSVFVSRLLGRDALFWAVLSNAAADGKRLRVIDALGGWKGRLSRPKAAA
jgi:hypothetical protein